MHLEVLYSQPVRNGRVRISPKPTVHLSPPYKTTKVEKFSGRSLAGFINLTFNRSEEVPCFWSFERKRKKMKELHENQDTSTRST